MKIFNSISDWIAFRESVNGSLGFVPTMGALHSGHFSLVTKAIEENTHVLVSIFVNPTQFNDPKDFENYPSTLADDLLELEKLNVSYVILPKNEEIYSDNYKYKILENDFSNILCGASRPGHFEGVLTVVMKLLNIANADNSYFGEKDFQQFSLIKNMTSAFFLKTKIISVSTIRESDGLALSSRNKLLTVDERKVAPRFYELLSSKLEIIEIKKKLKNAGFKVDYIEELEGRRFGAVFLGNVRLIDNVKI